MLSIHLEGRSLAGEPLNARLALVELAAPDPKDPLGGPLSSPSGGGGGGSGGGGGGGGGASLARSLALGFTSLTSVLQAVSRGGQGGQGGQGVDGQGGQGGHVHWRDSALTRCVLV